jgi:hypothetical protein
MFRRGGLYIRLPRKSFGEETSSNNYKDMGKIVLIHPQIPQQLLKTQLLYISMFRAIGIKACMGAKEDGKLISNNLSPIKIILKIILIWKLCSSIVEPM